MLGLRVVLYRFPVYTAFPLLLLVLNRDEPSFALQLYVSKDTGTDPTQVTVLDEQVKFFQKLELNVPLSESRAYLVDTSCAR